MQFGSSSSNFTWTEEFDPSNAGRRNHEKLSGGIVAG